MKRMLAVVAAAVVCCLLWPRCMRRGGRRPVASQGQQGAQRLAAQRQPGDARRDRLPPVRMAPQAATDGRGGSVRRRTGRQRQAGRVRMRLLGGLPARVQFRALHDALERAHARRGVEARRRLACASSLIRLQMASSEPGKPQIPVARSRRIARCPRLLADLKSLTQRDNLVLVRRLQATVRSYFRRRRERAMDRPNTHKRNASFTTERAGWSKMPSASPDRLRGAGPWGVLVQGAQAWRLAHASLDQLWNKNPWLVWLSGSPPPLPWRCKMVAWPQPQRRPAQRRAGLRLHGLGLFFFFKLLVTGSL